MIFMVRRSGPADQPIHTATTVRVLGTTRPPTTPGDDLLTGERPAVRGPTPPIDAVPATAQDADAAAPPPTKPWKGAAP